MSNLAGLGIVLLTILAICCLWFLFKAIFGLADWLQETIFDSDVHVLWKIVFFIPWLVVRLLTVFLVVLGLMCGISLTKDAINWFRK